MTSQYDRDGIMQDAGPKKLLEAALGISTATISRTKGFLVTGGFASGSSPPLSEKTCSKWLNILLRSRLMMLLYMGPNDGVLELRPYDEECDVEEITTTPGMLIILRSDFLSHHHVCSSEDYMLCNYVLGPALVGGRGTRNELKGLAPVTPVAKELADWAISRASKLKADLVEDGALATWDPKVPASWARAMNHMFATGIPGAIQGESLKMPGPYGCEDTWKVLAQGWDGVTEVPAMRWNHDIYYDQEPESYKKSDFLYHIVTNIRHGSFMEGTELFDTKFFGISPAEAKGMDPQQRMVLETSYEALHMAGYKKKDLQMAYIGVFGGSTNPEFAQVPMEMGAFSGTGSSEAIFCNRVSFCLGMQGPSTTIDCEMASASAAFYVSCSQVCPSNDRGSMLTNPAALANGGYVMLTPSFWPRFNYWMNPVGRCFSFDQAAAGYIRSEGVGSFLVRSHMQKVDDQWVIRDQEAYAVCSGYRMNNNGRNASMQAPNGAAEQMCVLDMLRQANVTELDVDAVELFGIGNLLQDAVEVGSAAKVYRGVQGRSDSGIMFGAVKTNMGAACEACGLSQIAKAVWGQRFACNIPSLHVKALNPHIELEETPVIIHSEPVTYRCRSSYHVVSSRGFGGTNVSLLFWAQSPEELVEVKRPSFRQQVFWFWPGGGGAIQDASSSCWIFGSWTQWSTPQVMEDDGRGNYTFVVTLGDSGCESFQIILDGDPSKALHPEKVDGKSGGRVCGPSPSESAGWLTIDGRVTTGTSSQDLAVMNSRTAGGRTKDRGFPGDQYLVRYQVAGKWRTLTWEKCKSASSDAVDAFLGGSYYVSGSFNDFGLTEMERVPDRQNSFQFEVELTRTSLKFNIVRNQDRSQAFYPPEESEEGRIDCFGPGSNEQGRCWFIKGQVGDRFTIQFSRTSENGSDCKKVFWAKKS
jgi:3-oxoacyl-(acyl-carrier-protein) synthase